MKPQSCKAKGRKFQQWVRDLILSTFPNLHIDDVVSRGMGGQGEDIMLSHFARASFPFSVECKHRASFAIYDVYKQASDNAKNYEPIAFIKANGKNPLVIIDAEYFMKLLVKD